MALLLIGAGLNLAISFAVFRCGLYELRQKLIQISLIWLLPVVGAALIGCFLRSQYESTRSEPAGGEESDADLPPLGHCIDGTDHQP
ncbi:hypothetical protein R0381_000607 [Jeongeupia wiesaeckerbachi]|uniref:hypothetical protein n=1 Tax=Jeongeupia wiesaeckerbachi TaxID=3051218 RepID=UPI003D806C1B